MWITNRNVFAISVVMATLCCVATFGSSASAAYRQVGNFAGNPGEVQAEEQGVALSSRPYREKWPEKVQLGGVGGMAVNYTGAGGVPKGTIYATGQVEGLNVSRYNPAVTKNGQTTAAFSESWTVVTKAVEERELGQGRPAYERCGPEGELVEQGGKMVSQDCLAQPIAAGSGSDVDIDQTTGNVYVYDGTIQEGLPAVTVYDADGSKVLTRFAVQASSGEPVASSPGNIHQNGGKGALAVTSTGVVYIYDEGQPNSYHRLMTFRPKTPGVYDEYEYAAGSDFATGFGTANNSPTHPVADAKGDVFVLGSERAIEQYDPAQPKAGPTCAFSFTKSGIQSLTVNASTGEVFFYSYIDNRIHHLSACSGGKFTDLGTTSFLPLRHDLTAMALDPTAEFEAGLEPGVLFGGSPSSEGGEISGQNPNVKYPSAMGYIFAPASELPPEVIAESVSHVSESSARLEAVINPRANPVRYVFEYLTAAEFEANESADRFAGAQQTPAGEGSVEGAKPVPVAATVGNLVSGAGYRFRVVARSACLPSQPGPVCVGIGSGSAFRTFPAGIASLPDGRRYELVSPPMKQGGQVFPANPGLKSCLFECKPGAQVVRFPLLSSPGGDSVVYEGEPFSNTGALIENEYLSTRSTDGWATTTLAPGGLSNRAGNGYVAFDSTLSAGLLRQGVPSLSSTALGEYPDLYEQSTAAPAGLMPLLSNANAKPTCGPGTGPTSLEPLYAGASADLSRIFFQVNDALSPEAAGSCGQTNLYEWNAGHLSLINVLSEGNRSVPGAVYGSGMLLLSGTVNQPVAVLSHAISTDGSHAFFTSSSGATYARVAGAQTLAIPGPGNCNEATPVIERVCFLSASSDGTRVLLSNGHILTANGAGTGYELDLDLTGGHGGFLGIAGQSEDLTSVFFADTGVLTGSEQNELGAVAEPGKDNLYSSSGGSVTFVATLAPADDQDWQASPVVRTAEASPHGRWLAFQSVASITGYDNLGECEPKPAELKVEEALCSEAFLYDSLTHRLSCASCNPSGSHPLGPSYLRTDEGAGGWLSQPRYLTDAGRLLFDSSDRLVARDNNGRVEDVYQYEPAGVGGCAPEDGCLSLISPGTGSADANFMTMDETGDNVFFTTGTPLVGADKDQLVDLYDARVGGGLPEPVPPIQCEGEACQQASPSIFGQETPSSRSVASEAPRRSSKRNRCKKGKVKRAGHCTEKHHKKTKNHKKSTGLESKIPGAREATDEA